MHQSFDADKDRELVMGYIDDLTAQDEGAQA